MRLRHVIVVALVALVAACGDATGSGPGGAPVGGGGGGGGGAPVGGAPDPCTFLPDAALETALGSTVASRELYGHDTCVFESTAEPRVVISVRISGNGRTGFENHRENVQGIGDLYRPLSGVGEDAFAFGHEVTVLQGAYSVTIFVEGPAFFSMPDSDTDRFERAKGLALAAAEQLRS